MTPSPRQPFKAFAVLVVALVLVHGAGAHVGSFDHDVSVTRVTHVGHGIHIGHDDGDVRIDIDGDDDDDCPHDGAVVDIDVDDGDDWS